MITPQPDYTVHVFGDGGQVIGGGGQVIGGGGGGQVIGGGGQLMHSIRNLANLR